MSTFELAIPTVLKREGHRYPDFRSLVLAVPDAELASPRRSTVPLLAYWSNFEERYKNLSHHLKLETPASEFSFEYAVPVQRGRGKPSYTDLMILGPSEVVAIEGKFTEPPYETVGDWLREPPEANRSDVLEGWFDLIRRATGSRLRIDDVRALPYQLVHRTASACFPDARHRLVVYQLFADEQRAYYLKQLSRLRILLGDPAHLKFFLFITLPEKLEAYIRLEERWNRGERDLSVSVREGLLSDSLLRFGEAILLPA